ncbi:pregnancy-specific glycoprotein 22-like [Alexandromys fortis]|uniref:pregnancy-specific glycoprotein 22-like n=1 Tax=Alexandromys fortis TaxID=100897 RepID=UPI00215275F6|nr:pregnancy-specific glycoprotein 22-like [Microtus fortis]
MESSVLLSKGCTPWQGFLITASFLALWHLSITASVTIESVPPLMAEGDNILFLVDNLPEKTVTLVWFKGLTNMKAVIAIYGRHINLSASGPLHSGRETIYYNGSLLIKNVTQKDTGFYTLRSYDKYLNIISTTYTYVHVHDFLWNCGRHVTSAQPTIESVPPIAAEGGSVRLLIHHLPENLQGFAWFKGMSVFRDHEIARITTDMNSSVMGPAHSGRETLNSDGSLLLHNITQNDAGLYTLRIMGTDLKSEEAHVQLHVNSSLSPCCNPLTSSQLMIQPVPLYAIEGEDVLLQVHNLPEDLQAFTWYRAIYRVPYFEIVKCSRVLNTTTWGDQYSRRETVYPNGSLLLQDVAEKDAGMYTLEILKSYFKTEKAYVQFHVNKFVEQPFVQITNGKVSSQRSVIFTCVSPDTDVSIRWIFNNQSLQLTERMTLSPTKCGLRIDPVQVENFGEYRCEVSNRVSSKTSLPIFFQDE